MALEQIMTMAPIFPVWEIGVDYSAGDLVRYGDGLYQVVQTHTSQEDWIPPIATSLFTRKTPEGEIGQWVQPVGAHDAYSIGDKVNHQGAVWVSTADANVWEPGVYGWEVHE